MVKRAYYHKCLEQQAPPVLSCTLPTFTLTETLPHVIVKLVANTLPAPKDSEEDGPRRTTRRFVIALADKGLQRALTDDEHLRNGLNVHESKITCCAVADALGYPYTPANDAVKR
jgi:alanine dehydrogenase